jgi:uncharacterized RDD family membrane protein YckC
VPPGGWQQPIAQGPGWAGQPLAGWGSRVGAALIDGLILAVPVIVIVIIVVAIAAGSDVGAVVVGLISTLAYIVAAIFYAPVLMSRDGARNGQTLGKQMVGIRVSRDTGEPVGFGFAMLREIAVKNLLFWFVGSFIVYIPTLLDVLWPLWDDQNRALHDMVCSTHVVDA